MTIYVAHLQYQQVFHRRGGKLINPENWQFFTHHNFMSNYCHGLRRNSPNIRQKTCLNHEPTTHKFVTYLNYYVCKAGTPYAFLTVFKPTNAHVHLTHIDLTTQKSVFSDYLFIIELPFAALSVRRFIRICYQSMKVGFILRWSLTGREFPGKTKRCQTREERLSAGIQPSCLKISWPCRKNVPLTCP